jgi:two-component system, OmpR family, alkaline phosphatase synthesis response regulator PhoP
MDSAKPSVLVVDDEPMVRHLVKRILGQRYTVIEAEDGIRAVEAAKADLPDLILMDMMMPSMDGLSACYAIRQEASTTRIPVVMLTAITHDLNRRLSETVMGANGYITKPFQPAELLSMVETLLSTGAAAVDCAASSSEPVAPSKLPNG